MFSLGCVLIAYYVFKCCKRRSYEADEVDFETLLDGGSHKRTAWPKSSSHGKIQKNGGSVLESEDLII